MFRSILLLPFLVVDTGNNLDPLECIYWYDVPFQFGGMAIEVYFVAVGHYSPDGDSLLSVDEAALASFGFCEDGVDDRGFEGGERNVWANELFWYVRCFPFCVGTTLAGY